MTIIEYHESALLIGEGTVSLKGFESWKSWFLSPLYSKEEVLVCLVKSPETIQEYLRVYFPIFL